MKLKTIYVHPPIPFRGFDWAAFDDDTYCGSDSDVIGRGATEEEAVEELMEKLGVSV